MLCLLFLSANMVFAEDENIESDINVAVTLREHGYTLGDMITMHVEFSLDKSYIFDPQSVPLKGPITSWLDLRDVTLHREKMDDDSELIKIDFMWQLFGTVKEAQIIQTPQILLRTLPVEVVGDEELQTLVINVPGQGVYLSSVLPEQLSDEDAPRPIIPPPKFDAATPLQLGFLCLILGTLLGVYWLYIKDKISFLPRHPGAMTLLVRQLRRQGVAKQAELTMTDLRTIHAALAKCAGQSLYPNTLNILFENSPYLQDEKDNISQFFDETWQLFHQQNPSGNRISKRDTLAWIHRAAMAERIFK
ncbi:MAG: hypothetical protein COA63_000590 [Methylophaga sp.]|nr:hypothetical protein [Methylophaga sp.]